MTLITRKFLNIPLLFLLMLLIASCGDTMKQHTPLANDAKILAFGDSITYGYNASPANDYPSNLRALSGFSVINAGISGEKAEDAKMRIVKALDEHHPDIVIIELGGNDFLQKRSPAAVKEDLRLIINMIKVKGAIPILVAIPEMPEFSLSSAINHNLTDSPIYEALATEEDIGLIPNIFSEILSDKRLKSDQVHPNDSGYRKLAEGINDALKKMGFY